MAHRQRKLAPLSLAIKINGSGTLGALRLLRALTVELKPLEDTKQIVIPTQTSTLGLPVSIYTLLSPCLSRRYIMNTTTVDKLEKKNGEKKKVVEENRIRS